MSGNNDILDLDPNSEAAGYLYKYVSAALAGELPYIPGSDEETQGIIRIKRRKNETEEAKDLTYIGYPKFQEMLESTDENIKQQIMNFYSLDESWNLCIAKSYKKTVNYYTNGTLTKSEGEYTISEVKIPYRTMVAQYTVPFLFLIDLQLITQNANYVEAVSELMTKQSEIEFTIFDSITKDTNEYQYNALRHTRTKKEVQLDGGEGVSGVSRSEIEESEADLETKKITVEEIDDIKANVTMAKTWIIEQETNYVMQETKEYPYGEDGTVNDLPDQEEVQLGSWDTNRKERYYEEIIKREWTKSGDTKTQIKPSKFMGLWSNETGTYVKGASYKPNGKDKSGKIVQYNMLKGTKKDRPILNIITSREELYDLLELRVTTQTHAELMKEIIEFYLSGEELEEDTFNKTAFTSMYEPSEFVDGSYQGDFDVHDESLFIKDINELKKAFRGGYSNSARLVENAQAFLDMQDKYKVNALFAASVSITETSAGTRGHAVDGHNNWFNIRALIGWRTYRSPAESIEDFGDLIAEGRYYYKRGYYTVGTIGPVYCPNTSKYPTQGDDWVASTLAQISRFYGAIGIDIGPIIDGGTGGGTASGDLKDLFPNGVPTSAAEMQQYLTTITIDINDASGRKTTTQITVHKKVAEDVKAIFRDIQASGFKIKSVGGYSWRGAAASSNRSHHSYGVAIDINPNENYMIKNGRIISGSFWKPGQNEFSITPDGPVVRAFARRGWSWGGNWKSSKDYMHFSLTGH